MEINIKTFGPSTNLEMLLKGLSESQKFLVNDGLDYKKIIDEDRFSKNSVFLSVLIRTQGKRRETLKETLLSLYAQTNQDFEIILLAHKVEKECIREIEEVLALQPAKFREKIRLIRVSYGERGAPLNAGWAYARGRYVSILDDDDVVFAHWIEEFSALANTNMGRILHAYSVTQLWSRMSNACSSQILRACGAPKPFYCSNFSWLSQLQSNSCPTLSLAFPSYLFQEYGFRFDEMLTTVEDYDFLQRTAHIAGVVDAPVITSIYRKWENVENSSTLHPIDVWNKNLLKIYERTRTTSWVLPPEGISEILTLLSDRRIGRVLRIKDFERKIKQRKVSWKDVKKHIFGYFYSRIFKKKQKAEDVVHAFMLNLIIREYFRQKLRKFCKN